jgi:16S rRNA (guanine527-N7)-methyltransferase
MPERKAPEYERDIRDLLCTLDEKGIAAGPGAGRLLRELGETVCRWNKRVNLISRKDIHRLVSYHFCDAASLLAVFDPRSPLEMLDVGGSNGLPGLVLGAISPTFRVTVCDSHTKRAGFLAEACDLFRGRATYLIGRVDDAAFRAQNAGKFDLVVARAVTRLRLLLKWCLPLVRPGGFIVAYKGSRCIEEARQAEPYLWAHGANLLMVIASPFAGLCNPLRQFAIVGRAP